MSEKPLPVGWKRSSLIGLAEYHNGAAFNPKHWGKDGLPIIRIEQINDPNAPTDYYDGPLIPQNRIADGDLIFSWSATLKTVIWKHGKGALNQHLFKVVPKADINKEFLFHVLDYHMERIASGSHGSTMKHITRKELQRYQVELPEKEDQQRRIAEILSTVDAAMEQTEALIAKYQQIKAGLMHDLFTRGVTPDGQLRPTRAQAPHLYKNDPILGWIPKEWKVKQLGILAEIVSGVTLGSKKEISVEVGVPYLRVANVQDGYFDLKDVKTIQVSQAQLEKLAIKYGDVLMNEGGDFDKLGRGSVWLEQIKPCIHQNHVFRVRPRNGKLRSFYLAFWSQSEEGRRYFVISSKQSTNLASINSTQLNRFPIALPTPNEQLQVEERIHKLNGYVDSLQTNLAKLRQQKQGLMQDLLTGRVRVGQDCAS